MAAKPKIVLVIDDEETMQDLIELNMDRLSIFVKTYRALTGEAGVEKYRDLLNRDMRPDLVIMDLNLTQWGEGKMDGVATTREILKVDPNANIYGYTAWFATRWASELQEAGAKKIIERTTLPSDFRKLIEDILTES